MQLLPELIDKNMGKEFRNLLKLTGEGDWKRKLHKLEMLPRNSDIDLYGQYLRNKNPLLSGIEQYMSLEKSGKSIWKHKSESITRAATYAYFINRISNQGNKDLKSKIKGRLLDDDSVRALLFELDISAHFLSLGYNVEFMDFNNKADYDFLVSDGHFELEVECKRKSADAGRKITRRDFYFFSDILFSYLKDTEKKFVVLVKCKDRLRSDQTLLRELAREIKRCLANNTTDGESGNLVFNIEHLPSGLQIKSNEEAVEILKPYWAGSEHFFVFSNRNTTVVIKCESLQRDRVLKAIYDELKKGATQFSRTRGGLLACFIEDINEDGWNQLSQDSGLSAMTHRLFANPERSHVRFVTYSSEEVPVRVASNVTSFSAANLSFENRQSKYSVPRSFLRFRNAPHREGANHRG